MAINLQSLINSPFGVGLGLTMARLLPRKPGHGLARFLAARIAGRKNMDMVKAVRANQWIVSGMSLSDKELDDIVQATFNHTARCLFDVYHNLRDQESMEKLIYFGPRAHKLISRGDNEDEGLIIVGPHLSNFDFVMQASGIKGLKGLVLSYASPGQGYQMQNSIRRASGLDIIPASLESMKKATELLRNHGTVLTGVDRPVPDPRHRPKFFGRPAPLTVHYVTLALRADVPVVVASAIMRTEGLYEIVVSDPVVMIRGGSRREELITNAERVLKEVEKLVKEVPYQWSMFYPVWPDLTENPL